MSLTSTDPVVVDCIDDMLRLIAEVKRERDPIRALEDKLLDMRVRVRAVPA